MLKLLFSTSSFHTRINHLASSSSIRPGPTGSSAPLLRALNSLSGFTRSSPNKHYRVFFCSDSKDGSGSDKVAEAEVEEAESVTKSEGESKSSSAIVTTYPKPEDYLTVGCLTGFESLDF